MQLIKTMENLILIVVEYDGEDYAASIPSFNGLFLINIKKLIVQDLKSSYPDVFEGMSINLKKQLTLYSDKEKTKEITDDIVSSDGKIFYARIKNHLVQFIQSLPAPSSFSKSSAREGWFKYLVKKGYKEKLVCHRYATEKRGIPVTLMCPFFGDFVRNCYFINIDSNDCTFAMKLMSKMSGRFEDENARAEEFRDILREYGINLVTQSTGKYVNHGSINFAESNYWLCIVELKNEKGEGGGDPYMQAIAYYLKKFEERGSASDIRIPCILLDLCGYALGVSGIINTPSRYL
jgi:hypothetical protein